MIGLWSPNEGVSFADYAYLYQLDTENWKLGEELSQRHLVSDGGAPGMLGVHFRLRGRRAGHTAKTADAFATERNTFLSGTNARNDWQCIKKQMAEIICKNRSLHVEKNKNISIF